MAGRKVFDASDAQFCLEAAAAAGISGRDWDRQNGVDARLLHAWRMILGRKLAVVGAPVVRLVELVELEKAASPPACSPCGVRKTWRVGEHAPPILLRNRQPHIRGNIVEPTRLPLTGVRTDPLRGPAAHVVGFLWPGWDRSGNHRVPACPWCFHRPERKAPPAVCKALQMQAVLAYDSRLRGAGIQPLFASHHLGNPGSAPEPRALPILLRSALSAKRGGNLLPTGGPLAVEVTVAGGHLEWSQRGHSTHPGERPGDRL
jgi:hypothetical protein